ncbi:SDR family oxidoreductase [Devosia ginsengisoli]|uniref:SDR family oxidoreductase n=1 Tax=Devosia ginsengisoli TaxID=400770 RepID=UPI0026EB5E91|nr:SDR family oxidoreductase [Devosia ginsengisoli]MCR6671353.1 SDR family oxidoreductase [Devosia ginsengisoli]
MRLEGKVVVVTGAGGGIGSATCARLLDEGASIAALDRWSEQSLATADLAPRGTVSAQAAGRIVALDADVTDATALEAAVAAAGTALGEIDGAFLNAGILRGGNLQTTTDKDWQDTLDVNLTGVWKSARAVTGAMRAHGRGGSVVITSSISGLRGAQDFAAYAAAKHGVVGLMRSMAQELGPLGIRVNTLHPTSVDTPMVNSLEHAQRWTKSTGGTMADLEAIYRARHLLPVAWLDPRDIANAVLWLLSDEARYVTGVTLPLDAGLCVK